MAISSFIIFQYYSVLKGLCTTHGGGKPHPKCRIEGCTKNSQNKGVCQKHGAIKKTCTFVDASGNSCTNKVVNRSLCHRHFRQKEKDRIDDLEKENARLLEEMEKIRATTDFVLPANSTVPTLPPLPTTPTADSQNWTSAISWDTARRKGSMIQVIIGNDACCKTCGQHELFLRGDRDINISFFVVQRLARGSIFLKSTCYFIKSMFHLFSFELTWWF